MSACAHPTQIDIFALDFLIVPVHVGGSHWCLGVINFREKRLEYYDSLGVRLDNGEIFWLGGK